MSSTDTATRTGKNGCPFNFLIWVCLAPITAAIILYRIDPFDPAPLPVHEFTSKPISAPKKNPRMLHGSERLGSGILLGPEDLAYDPKSQVLYTGCGDGWIKRVKVTESVDDTVIEDVANTGGRPLGVALGLNNDIVVAGLFLVSEEGEVKLLTDEAEGLKFKLTDGVDVGEDGMIYFTDATYKHNLSVHHFDMLEGRPHGRVLSYNPSTKETKVLLQDLFFANGLALSPDQTFFVFCETILRRCSKYNLRGHKKGSVEKFVENLPGFPDNIRYDGEGQFWIAMFTETTTFWDLAWRYPFIRKTLAIAIKYIPIPITEKNSGVMAVDMDGNPVAHYFDPKMSAITTGVKIGNYLYCGSIYHPYITRLDLSRFQAQESAQVNLLGASRF
ncbi:hypothetical protein RJ641_010823 [Dillenia turbinata]|uniref:Strictosidine synthase conserved region domain-containing protein n=1 Tax=Dillenia turbinata TaxID=194707 RepID=A0AAN8V0A6_9MAGN